MSGGITQFAEGVPEDGFNFWLLFSPDGVVKRNETIYNMVAMKNNKLQKRMDQIAQVLGELYPNPSCALNFSCPLELLIATILSAQCTDKRVNEVSQTLFKKISNR